MYVYVCICTSCMCVHVCVLQVVRDVVPPTGHLLQYLRPLHFLDYWISQWQSRGNKWKRRDRGRGRRGGWEKEVERERDGEEDEGMGRAGVWTLLILQCDRGWIVCRELQCSPWPTKYTPNRGGGNIHPLDWPEHFSPHQTRGHCWRRLFGKRVACLGISQEMKVMRCWKGVGFSFWMKGCSLGLKRSDFPLYFWC